MSPAVLVVGAGIAGIQASIDLARMGFEVYLVERTPSIGGRMAQLDKTFPTNDCAICILAPKMSECATHENIHLLTYSEVILVEGRAGSFRARVLRRPRYVNIDRCTGCGECVERCPREVDDEFNFGLSHRRAIYLPFPQALPRKMTIDPDHCIYLSNRDKVSAVNPKKGPCRLCEKVCEAGAIDWGQQEETIHMVVGAIVIATGFDPYDASQLEEYGHDRIPNVITSLQYERLVSASGPTSGRLLRPSDGEHPRSVAFIQCVGSRDVNHNPYCSSVCCMFATKEAILANEHDPELRSYVFYTDLRAAGKGFQKYVARAREEYRVAYIRSRPGSITHCKDTGNPVVHYEDTTTQRVLEMEVGLVVLCQALIPRRGQRDLADVLGIELDEHGFVGLPSPMRRPWDTSVSGIFACGYCHSPQDIPDSVAQASAVAARVAEMDWARATVRAG